MRTRHLIPLAAALGSFAVAAPAGAATLSSEGDTLVWRAAPGQSNSVHLYPGQNPNTINIGESSDQATITAPGCVDNGDYGIECPQPAKLRVELGDGVDSADFGSDFPSNVATEIYAGDGNDNLENGLANYAPTSLLVDGGNGNDVIKGGNGNDTLRGGPGNDQLFGSGGDDRIEGGDGDDYMRPDYYADPFGSDYVDGGAGNDKVDDWVWPEVEKPHPPISVTLDGVANDGRPGEDDNVVNVESIESSISGTFVLSDADDTVAVYASTDQGSSTIQGKGGNDKLTGGNYTETIDGGSGDDRLEGGYGNDTITGGPGRDMIYGDSTASQCGFLQSCTVPFGNDTIYARDGEADVIDCGVGEDTAVVDAIDTVANCETVDKPGATPTGPTGPSTPGTTNALAATFGNVRLKAALSSGLPLTVTAPTAGKVTVTVTNGKKKVAALTKSVKSGKTTLKLRFTSAAKKSLKRVKKVTVKATVSFAPADGAKQVITAKRTLK